MTQQPSNYEELIQNAAKLFRSQGYFNTSISDIAHACDIKKATVYHYTSSKQMLGVAALKMENDAIREQICDLAFDETLTPKERLGLLSRAIEKYFSDRKDGCLIGNMALETANLIPEFATVIKQHFEMWINSLAHILKPQHGKKQAQTYAEDLVSQLQGTLMMMRVYDNSAPLKRICRHLPTLL